MVSALSGWWMVSAFSGWWLMVDGQCLQWLVDGQCLQWLVVDGQCLQWLSEFKYIYILVKFEKKKKYGKFGHYFKRSGPLQVAILL